MTRWQAELERQQAVLGRIADIGAELFAIASAVVYADPIRRPWVGRDLFVVVAYQTGGIRSGVQRYAQDR